MLKALVLLAFFFGQYTQPLHIPTQPSGGSCTLPFTDNFTGTGPLGSPCWTQTSAAGYSALTQVSGTVTSASSGYSAAYVTGTGTATTQSIQTTLNFSGSGHSGIVLHSDTAGANFYTWNILDEQVYAINAGTATLLGNVSGGAGSPTSGDELEFSVSGTTLTVEDVTNSGTQSFTVPGPNIVASGYAGLSIDTNSNPQNFGPVTVN